MATVSKKKMTKKSVKDSGEVMEECAALQTDEEEDLERSDEEDRGDEGDDERRHHKLLEAISALGGQRKRKLGERSEAAVNMSEYTVTAEGEGDKIQLSDLIGSMEQTPAVPTKTRKQLKNLQQGNRTIACPLSQQESGRIQRDVAFHKAAAEVSRWKAVITHNQRAEQLVFPLNQEPSGPRPMERVVTGWKAHTPLEQEIFALLRANKQPLTDPVLTPAEEASIRAMSLDDAKVRRAELQKARALQSYYEARARREGKIKSKKYHRVHNKAKRKDMLKTFEQMVQTDPAAALQELEKIELARMQERMSLKHQNSGKWAKSKAIMAKYDEGARKAMQQQLEVNKELTSKVVTSLKNQEEEEEEAGQEEMLPDCVNDAEQAVDCSNPWMRGKLSEEPTVPEQPAPGPQEEEEEEEEEEKETEEEVLLRHFDSRRKQRQEQVSDNVTCVEEDEEKALADPEEEGLSQADSMLTELEQELPEEAPAAAEPRHSDTCAPLEEGLLRVRTLEDMELLSQEEPAADEAPVEPTHTQPNPAAAPQADRKRKKKRGIQLKEVLSKDTLHIHVPLAPTLEDTEEEKLEQRGLIQEAFAGDDVVADFLKDKKRQEDLGKPAQVDLTLPGWGEWGGTGLKPSRNKRRKYRLQTAPPPPRRDQHLPTVIICEQRNRSMAPHQPSSLPFPFENQAQFESSMRAPLGRTWNTERTVRKLSQPRVVTQLGAYIQPMARDQLLKPSDAHNAFKRKGQQKKN